MYIYTYVYKHNCIHIFTYTYVCMYSCVCMFMYIYLHTYVYIYKYIYVCTYIYISTYKCTYVYIHLTHEDTYMYIHIYIYPFLHLHHHICWYTCVHIYLYVRMYILVHAHISACICSKAKFFGASRRACMATQQRPAPAAAPKSICIRGIRISTYTYIYSSWIRMRAIWTMRMSAKVTAWRRRPTSHPTPST